MPILRNLIDHETAHGYRTFELWQGDITDPGFSVDILAVSYSTSPRILATSVVAALKRRYGISVHSIVEDDAAYDLRQALGVSLSHELTGSSAQATCPFVEFSAWKFLVAI